MSIYDYTQSTAKSLIASAEEAGVFKRGTASDSRGRGEAISVALVGASEKRDLIVVQVRQSRFRPGWHDRVRKDHYLIGRNEDGSIFAHPVDSPLRSAKARKSYEGCVEKALSDIWGCRVTDLDDIVRQGDIAFVPTRARVAEMERIEADSITLRDTHVIRAREIYRDGYEYYVRGPAFARHTKRQHAPVRVSGTWRVVAGYRAQTWGFTEPSAD